MKGYLILTNNLEQKYYRWEDQLFGCDLIPIQVGKTYNTDDYKEYSLDTYSDDKTGTLKRHNFTFFTTLKRPAFMTARDCGYNNFRICKIKTKGPTKYFKACSHTNIMTVVEEITGKKLIKIKNKWEKKYPDITFELILEKLGL